MLCSNQLSYIATFREVMNGTETPGDMSTTLDVEAEMHDVTFLDPVLLSFEPPLALLFRA